MFGNMFNYADQQQYGYFDPDMPVSTAKRVIADSSDATLSKSTKGPKNIQTHVSKHTKQAGGY